MLQGRADSMVLISLGAIITALGAIGPPNIVDLPEFAPVFPTTALFGRAFRCLERLEYRAHLPGDSRTPSEGGSSSLFPERNSRIQPRALGRVRE